MPLGNPMDNSPYYIEGGDIQNVEISINVTNVEESREFYRDSIKLEEESPGVFRIPNTNCKIRLVESSSQDVMITLITDSVFTLHRKLMDENVEILKKPVRNKEGDVEAVFTDPDNNKFRILEITQRPD
ncbi:VOC family protein [Candidatus Methanomassiliicoccus intestinalis]|uniref:VOC family protein n=1 Tax=Candidatus Methanomassiliicoccus intestinalis TaxID=1406512 RepID=UPI0037DC4392